MKTLIHCGGKWRWSVEEALSKQCWHGLETGEGWLGSSSLVLAGVEPIPSGSFF
jgi:hypothetical protein